MCIPNNAHINYTRVTLMRKHAKFHLVRKLTFLYILEEEQVLNKILLFYRPSSFRCEDRAADKQPVNEAIVEKLRSKIDFRLLEQYSVFLCKSVNIITSFNNSHTVNLRIRGDSPFTGGGGVH